MDTRLERLATAASNMVKETRDMSFPLAVHIVAQNNRVDKAQLHAILQRRSKQVRQKKRDEYDEANEAYDELLRQRRLADARAHARFIMSRAGPIEVPEYH